MNILKLLTPKRKTGNRGEAIAARTLRKKGYNILRRNYVAFDSEIDIIAENKEYLCFVEVKTRSINHTYSIEPRPASAVTPEKQRKIISAAKYYIGGRENTKKVRLDVIEVYLNEDGSVSKVDHIENAFNLNTAYTRYERYT